MLHKMSKSKKAVQKVKEAMSSVDKSTIENLQKDSTQKKCFDQVGNRLSERTLLESSHKERITLSEKLRDEGQTS